MRRGVWGPRGGRTGQIARAGRGMAALEPSMGRGRRPAGIGMAGVADLVRRIAQRVREWVAVEAGPGRLVPWLAITYGCGIAVYFAADREPAPWAVSLLLAATVVTAFLCRRRPIAFPLAVGAAAIAAGLTTATIKRTIIAHPVLSAPVWNAEVAGFIEMREERE